MRASFHAWLSARGNAGAGEDMAALAAVRRFIEQHGESRFTTIYPPGEQHYPAQGETVRKRCGGDIWRVVSHL